MGFPGGSGDLGSIPGLGRFPWRRVRLPTPVFLGFPGGSDCKESVKAMVFPVVMYGCESWTVKKAERRRIDAFELWC